MKRLLPLLFLLFCWATYAFGQNFSHIRTGGFDYAYDALYEDVGGDYTEAEWVATHHDVVIGLGDWDHWRTPEALYDAMMAANPNLKLYGYVAYNTMLEDMDDWMRTWIDENSGTSENLYYHYSGDTIVHLRSGSTLAVKGWGEGTASSVTEARVPSCWWNGAYPNICPTSSDFRNAFNAYCAYVITVNAGEGKYTNGVLLDTYEGTIDDYYDIHLENTNEMIALSKDTEELANAQATADIIAHKNELEAYLTTISGASCDVFPNGADIDNIYLWYPELYTDALSSVSSYNELCIEYLISSGYNAISRITRMKQLYDDMDAGYTFFVNSQTTYEDDLTFDYVQFILGTHYLVNHPNGIFSYHRGSASYYGHRDGTIRTTHWHKNIEYDIGSAQTRSETDYWGDTGTSRFYTLYDGGDSYKVLARDYENALIMCRFNQTGGWANVGGSTKYFKIPNTGKMAIGTSQGSVTVGSGKTHSRGGYQRLLSDNTLGDPITGVTLGGANGVILIRFGE